MSEKVTRETSPYLEICEVGGVGGSPFKYLGEDHKGHMVSIISVYVGSKVITGIEIVLTNGHS